MISCTFTYILNSDRRNGSQLARRKINESPPKLTLIEPDVTLDEIVNLVDKSCNKSAKEFLKKKFIKLDKRLLEFRGKGTDSKGISIYYIISFCFVPAII